MAINNKNFYNINLSAFSSEFCAIIEDALKKFWEQQTKVALYALNDFSQLRDEALISKIDFFSSQIKVKSHKPVIMRLSKDFTENFLDITLSDKPRIFKLTDLTPLEVKILNNFCEYTYKRIKSILIPPENVKLSDLSEQNINFLFHIKSCDNTVSKIMFSIPQDRVSFTPLEKVESFSDEDFITSSTTVKIKAGSSKITYEDLQNLAIDDIVLLEESDISKMTLISGDFEKKFNIKTDESLILDFDDDETENQEFGHYAQDNEVTMEKNLWDDIQIEINAEFEKVKMTIGELKQITQGQIVDLGSIFDNEISLFVENKKVAKGELLIVNDRYAVRLNEVLSSPKAKPAQEKIPPKSPQTAQKPQAQPQQQTQVQQKPIQSKASAPAAPAVEEDEEFDYSDFEK